jgi:PAS domain S-box-containing protein/putative nucleotidyltransferase with HDIG domain
MEASTTEQMHDLEYPSEELYKILFEQAADGIFIADESGRFSDVNPRGYEMLGYSREEILQLSVQELFSVQDLKHFSPQLDELRTGKMLIIERDIRRKDGTYIPVEVSARMLSNGMVLGLIRDVSKRKQIEAETLQLARFPSENPNPVLRVSREGKILYANDASVELLQEWNTGVGGMLPSAWKKTTSRLAEKRSGQNVEVPCKGRVYSMTITPAPGTDYVNLYGSDITEIKRSEKALHQAEEKYFNIFENSQDGIFQSTPDGRFITVNPALARIWGYESPEEVIKGITNIAHQIYVKSEQREEFLRLMDENREVQDFEFQAYRKDGSVIWVQENIRTVRDVDGNVQYYEGTVKDITEQKQTVAALRRSEERYRNTLNNMMEGCQIIDYDWRYIYVNDMAAMHGRHKPEEMLMRTMMELYPGIEKTEMFAVLQRCMEKRVSERIENEFTFPNGKKGWFELGIQPVPEGLFILSLDISERKQAENDLKDREARYRTLFENLPIPVFTKDREGRYTSFNTAESEYWAESPIGYTDHELLPAEIADDLRAVDLQVMESGESWSGEELFQSPSGLLHSLSRKVPLLDRNGDVIGILGASVDITKRKQAEKQIKQQLDRLTALREIDRFITSSFNLNQTLDNLIKEVTQQLDVDAASILLFNSVTNTLEHIAGAGFHGNSAKKLLLKENEDYAGKIVVDRKMIQISDITEADPPFKQASLINEEKFVAYFGLPLIAKGQIKGVMEVFHRSRLHQDEEWLSYLETLAGQAAIAIDNAQLFNNLQQTNTELTLAYDATIEGWSYALDLRDKETEGHTQRVTEITYNLCEKFGMSESELTYVRWGALLHDIGKMGIPDSILLKPGKLSEDEWVIMKMHPVFARKMLERVNYLKSAIDIPYYHHEKWDGSGYPEGLKGEQIPLTARIFAVADVWDALTSDRPYRPAWSKKDALKYIESAADTHLDPQVVEVFLESKELWKISSE